MKGVNLIVALCLPFLLSATIVLVKEGIVNKLTPGLSSPSSQDEGESFRKLEAKEHVTLNDNDELDGGFSSLDAMLQWKIGHDDVAMSRKTAQTVRQLTEIEVRTVKVSNIPLKATERDVEEFFSFTGDIQYVETMSENADSQTAFVTFKDPQGADTAVLLTGATIVDKTVIITLEPEYVLPSAASTPQVDVQSQNSGGSGTQSALQKAEDVTSMLAKGFILGKDIIGKAKSFDEKYQLTSTASTKISSFDKKIGFSKKITMGNSAIDHKVKEVNKKYQVSEKTKSAYNAAVGEKVSNARSAILKNRYMLTGTTWATGVFNRMAKAASEVGQQTKEKVGIAEEQQKK